MKLSSFLNKYSIIILSLIMAITIILSQAYLIHYAKNKSNEIIALKEIKQKIIYYDEVLTMTARVAALKNDASLEARYIKYERLLESVLEQAISLAPNSEAEISNKNTSFANNKLVEMENNAFALVKEGREKEAREILFSPLYESYKEDYHNGIKRFNKVLDAESKTLFDSVFYIGIVRNTAIVGLLLFIIFLAIRNIRQHRDISELAELKSDFLDVMSHEIRTPMNGIIGIAELLSQSNLDQDDRKYVRTILSSSKALMQVLQDILDLSKLNNNRLDLSNERFDLKNIAQTVVDLEKPAATEKNIDVILRYQIEENNFFGDPIRIQQILSHLVNNAIYYTDDGLVMIDISLSEQQSVSNKFSRANQKTVEITVTDTGIGIPEELQPYLFSDIVNKKVAIDRRRKGSGLGLSICKQLVDLMGGTIDVVSEPQNGSSFIVRIPFVVEPLNDRVGLLFPTNDTEPKVMFFGFDDEIEHDFLIFLQDRGISFHIDDNVSKGFEVLKKARENNKKYNYIFFDVERLPTQSVMFAKLVKNDVTIHDTKVIFIGDRSQENQCDETDIFMTKETFRQADSVIKTLLSLKT